MKIGIITDQHFGARKGSTHFHEYCQKYYDDPVFPAIDREGITTLIDMGDTFDNREALISGLLNGLKKIILITCEIGGLL